MVFSIIISILGFYVLVVFASKPREKEERRKWRIIGFIILLLSFFSQYESCNKKDEADREFGILEVMVDSMEAELENKSVKLDSIEYSFDSYKEERKREKTEIDSKLSEEQISNVVKSSQLKDYLKNIPETNDNGSTFQSIFDYLDGTRFNSKNHLTLLIKLLDLSADYPDDFHPDGNLRYFFLKTLSRDFPDEIISNNTLHKVLTKKERDLLNIN